MQYGMVNVNLYSAIVTKSLMRCSSIVKPLTDTQTKHKHTHTN